MHENGRGENRNERECWRKNGKESMLEKYKEKVVIMRKGTNGNESVAVEKWLKEQIGEGSMVEAVTQREDMVNV